MRRWLWRWRWPLWAAVVTVLAVVGGHSFVIACLGVACVAAMVQKVVADDLIEANDDLINALREQNRELRRRVRLLESEAGEHRRFRALLAEHQRRRPS